MTYEPDFKEIGACVTAYIAAVIASATNVKWTVTSWFRDKSPSHESGWAIDLAPDFRTMEGYAARFGYNPMLNRRLELFKLLTDINKSMEDVITNIWVLIAIEPDHLHITIVPREMTTCLTENLTYAIRTSNADLYLNGAEDDMRAAAYGTLVPAALLAESRLRPFVHRH